MSDGRIIWRIIPGEIIVQQIGVAEICLVLQYLIDVVTIIARWSWDGKGVRKTDRISCYLYT